MIITTAKEVAQYAKSIIESAYETYGCKVQLTGFYENIKGKKHPLSMTRGMDSMYIFVSCDGSASIFLNHELPYLGKNFLKLKDDIIGKLKEKGITYKSGEYFSDFFIMEFKWKF